MIIHLCINTLLDVGNDHYLLYDNGNHSSQYTGLPNISRAVEYHLDLDAMTCENIWEYTIYFIIHHP